MLFLQEQIVEEEELGAQWVVASTQCVCLRVRVFVCLFQYVSPSQAINNYLRTESRPSGPFDPSQHESEKQHSNYNKVQTFLH